MNVRLSQEQKVKILNSEDVYKIMQQVLLRENKIRRNQEHFWIIGLDTKNKLLFVELVSLGAVNSVKVSPPELFRLAIYKMAVKIILVHNHPSGDLTPSNSDLDLTDRMIKSGQILNVEVVDHLIISEDTFYSFADQGEFRALKKSDKYTLIDKEKAALQELKVQTAKELSKEKEAKRIARRLLLEGVDKELVKKFTGLSKKQIEEMK